MKFTLKAASLDQVIEKIRFYAKYNFRSEDYQNDYFSF